MKAKSPILTSISGGVSSVVTILFAACKGGACVGVCVTPVASLFGISAAAIAASPIVSALEPILIAISAVSFTISYYSLYVIPKKDCGTDNSCTCGPSPAAARREKISKIVFWFGLILSIGFFSYFEYSKYQNSVEMALSSASCSVESSCGEDATGSGSCGEESDACCTDTSGTSSCDNKETGIVEKSTITCLYCGHKKLETLPKDLCQIRYTCEHCKKDIFPKTGDCCVYCSYGDRNCPSKQDES